MNRRASLAIIIFFTLPLCWAGDKPQRIVSLSLCTDQVLLMLVPSERIAAVTHLAVDSNYSYMWQEAQGLTIHSGLAEEIVPLHPDLIIGDDLNTSNSVQMLRQLQQTVVSFGSPTTLQETEHFTRQLGAVVGEPERAEQLINTMRAEIITAKKLVANQPELLAISYAPNGFTAGKHTLKNEIIRAAGYRNLAAELGIEFYGNLSIEQLLYSKPDVVIVDEEQGNRNSLAHQFISHPALKRLLGDTGMATIRGTYWLCPGPLAAKAILALAEQRQ